MRVGGWNESGEAPTRWSDDDVRVGSEVDPREESSRNHNQGTLGRAVPGILVDDHVANGRLARDELRNGLDLLDDDVVGDRRRIAAEERDRHQLRRAVGEAEDDDQGDDD